MGYLNSGLRRASVMDGDGTVFVEVGVEADVAVPGAGLDGVLLMF